MKIITVKDSSVGTWRAHADDWYVTARMLWYTGFHDQSIYIASLSIEMYLKAFLVQTTNSYVGGNDGHNLTLLREQCALQNSGLFNKKEVIEDIERFNGLYEAIRYPEGKEVAYVLSVGLINKLDFLAWNIRKILTVGEGYVDLIEETKQKYITDKKTFETDNKVRALVIGNIFLFEQGVPIPQVIGQPAVIWRNKGTLRKGSVKNKHGDAVTINTNEFMIPRTRST
jgi:HEPN domain-containing protein